MIGLLPAAGLATRMGSLPKFLLPILNGHQSLLDWHLASLLDCTDQVVILTRPENAILLSPWARRSRVSLLVTDTQTMSETVHKAVDICGEEIFVLGMPDTFFHGENPYPRLVESSQRGIDLSLAVWRIRPEQIGRLGQVDISVDSSIREVRDKDSQCEFPWAWGAMAFNGDLVQLLPAESPHVGYLIPAVLGSTYSSSALKISGDYYDCGTPEEYSDVLSVLNAGRPNTP